MTTVQNEAGQININTGIYLPRELVVKARELQINRSALFRRALEEEIKRLTERAEAPHVVTHEAPGSAPVKEANLLDHDNL